jgi:hypothetical protein
MTAIPLPMSKFVVSGMRYDFPKQGVILKVQGYSIDVVLSLVTCLFSVYFGTTTAIGVIVFQYAIKTN